MKQEKYFEKVDVWKKEPDGGGSLVGGFWTLLATITIMFNLPTENFFFGFVAGIILLLGLKKWIKSSGEGHRELYRRVKK